MKKKILIIDDSKPILTLLHVILNKKYEVMAASNAFDAMSWLNGGNSPDMIISDLQMPEIDGWEFIENLRTSFIYDNIPIIVLSGLPSKDMEVQCRMHGINDYVQKPFDPVILLEKINEIFFKKYATT